MLRKSLVLFMTINQCRRFVVRKSQWLFLNDQSIIKTEFFEELCRNKPNVLVRRRKMPTEDLIYSMINRKGLTLKLELRNYMKITHPGTEISKPGYLKQRMKLNPEAIKFLYQNHNRNFYSDPEITPYLYKEHLVFAVDGSDINIPTTSETLERFGSASRKGTKPQAQIGLGCLYDVLNRFIIESDLNRVKFDEMKIAEQQIDRLSDTIGTIRPFFVIMDRGYPSIPSFLRMIDKGIKFVVRLKSSDFKSEQQALDADDEDVIIKLTKSRRYHYMGTENEALIMSRDEFSLRLVTVRLENGNSEILATNLSREQFPQGDFREIYHMRWQIETAYETLKDRLQLENFTGTKAILLEQDIYSTIYVSNLAEDIICDIEEQNQQHLKQDYKHTMQINRSISIGLLKGDLIYILLESDAEKKRELMRQLYDEISKNVIPIRPDRHYKRTKGQLAGNYSNTYKRCF